MVDLENYRSTFKFKFLWICILMFGIVYVFQKAVTPLIILILVNPIFSKIVQSQITNILLSILFLYSLKRVINAIHLKQFPTFKSSLFFVTFTIIYFCIVRNNSEFNFFSFSSWGLDSLKYADIIFISFTFLFIEFRSYNHKLFKDSSLSLIEDNADPLKIIDQYGRKGYASTIASYINNTTTDSSFALGIFAEWGAGKTDFILRLKTLFIDNENQTKNENIVVEFNPWKLSNKEAMIDDFFLTIAKALQPFNKSISDKIREYSKKIFQQAGEIQFRAIDIIVNDLMKDESVIERYNSINNSIRQTGKRLIILIDDLDRLTGKEVIGVLRLIRNTANFANTFFIVALDHSYITAVLKKTNLLANEEQYLKKMFQLVITLPKIRKDIFRRELRNLLKIDLMPLSDREAIDRVLELISYDPKFFIMYGFATPRHESHLEAMLHNMRDLKRFANSFKISFEILKYEVELLDLALLELLKIGCFEIFDKLSNSEFFKIEENASTYSLDENKWNVFIKSKDNVWDKNYIDDLKSLLSLLISAGNKNQRALAYPSNFYLYFSFQLFNLISLKEFNDAINSDTKNMSNIFAEWAKTKTAEFNTIIDNYDNFKNTDEFKKFILAFLFVGDSKNLLADRAARNLLEYQKFIPKYFKDEKEFLLYLNEILADSEISIFNRALVAKEFLKASIIQNKNILQPKIEWLKILLNLFEKYLNNSEKYDGFIEQFYFFNEEGTDKNNRILINPEASKKLHEFILKDKRKFESFLNFVIRSYSLPNQGGIFVFNPFTENIFGDWLTFQKEVEAFETHEQDVLRIRKIILEHIEEVKLSKENKFILSGDDMNFMIEHLQSTGQYIFMHKKND